MPTDDTGLSALLDAIVNRDGATADLRTRRTGSGRSSSRCYSRKLDPAELDPVELSSPAELLALDRLHPLQLPAGVWVVQGRNLSEPIGFMHH